MIKYFKTNKVDLFKYLILVPLVACSSAFFSKSMQPLLDVAYNPEKKTFLKYAGIFIGLGILDMLFFYCHKVFREKLRKNFLIGLKKDVFSGILKMDIGGFQKNTPAYYISVIQRDIKEINACYFDAICGIYRVAVSFIITFFVLVLINPWLSLLNILIAFLSVILPKIFEKKIEAASEEASKRAEEYQAGLSDALSGFNTIKLFSITARMEEQMEKRNIENESAQYYSTKMNFTISCISILCSQLGYILPLVIGVFFVLNAKMTVGGIVAVSQLIGGILAPFEELPSYVTDLKSIQVIVKRLKN